MEAEEYIQPRKPYCVIRRVSIKPKLRFSLKATFINFIDHCSTIDNIDNLLLMIITNVHNRAIQCLPYVVGMSKQEVKG